MVDSYQFKLCSEKTGYEVKPSIRISLDLMSLQESIVELSQMRVKVGIPALLLLEGKKGQIINIFPSGRLLLRNFSTQEEAEKLVHILAPLLYT